MRQTVYKFYQRLIRVWGIRLIALVCHPKSWLKQSGWLKSYGRGRSIDKDGNPLPWYNYSCIHFLEDRLNKGMRVFEYGCGNSSIWYSQRVACFTAVEHSKRWAMEIRDQMSSNGEIILCEEKEKYLAAPTLRELFDIIIIDGQYRNECCAYAVRSLTDKGVIILDDSERQDCEAAITFLRQSGFKHISFRGAKPCSLVSAQTSIFYRQDNILNI